MNTARSGYERAAGVQMTKNKTRLPDAIRKDIAKVRARQAELAARGAALEESEKGKADGVSLAVKAKMHASFKKHWDDAEADAKVLTAELKTSIAVHGDGGVGGLR